MKSLFWRTTTTLGSTDEKICASHTNVFLFLLNRTWNFSSQSFVKWTDEQVSHLVSVLVVSLNNALQLSHILCFIKLSSSVYENLHDSISSFEAKFSWTKFSLSGICFSSVQSSTCTFKILYYFNYHFQSKHTKNWQKNIFAKKIMTNKKFHTNSNFSLIPKTAKLVILEWSYVFSFLVWLYSYLLLLILKKSCISSDLHRWMCTPFYLSISL